MIPAVTLPGGKPVIDVPGLTPTSPVMTVGPVLVTVEAPKTAKLFAEPRGGADCAHTKLPILIMQVTNRSRFMKKVLSVGLLFIFAVNVRSSCSERHTLFFF